MSALDEVRDRLASGTGTWRSMRAEGRAWEDRLASRDARTSRGRQDRRGRSQKVSASAAEALGEREQSWRLWRGGSALLRCEFGTGGETTTVVAQGPRWWRSSPSLGTAGGSESRSVALLIGPAVVLVEGPRLVGDFQLVDAAPTHFLGRDAFVVRARPDPAKQPSPALLAELGRGADEYQVVVDGERGVVLSMAALSSGRPFRLIETSVVAFDEELPPNLFTPDKPATDQGAHTRAHRRLSLDELAATVPFTVLVPDPPPSATEPHVSLMAAAGPAGGAPRAMVTYPLPSSGGARGNLRLQLASAQMPTRSSEHWRSVGDCEVCDAHPGGRSRPRVRLRRAGTYAELESSVLSSDRLVAIARSLVPLRRS